METNYSRSGRLKRPTDKFQSYVQESSLRKKCKPVSTTNNGDNVILQDQDKDPGHNQSVPTKKKKSLKHYSCSHCGFMALKKNVQEFIKGHHLKNENKECFKNGLIHCPNPACNKPFLSDIDMERHCTMSDPSKSKCLQAYREKKLKSVINLHHSSTQVDFCSSSSPSFIAKRNDIHQVQCNTLNIYPLLMNTPNNAPCAISLKNNVTSRSHHHNVLIMQGLADPTENSSQTTSNSGNKKLCDEPDSFQQIDGNINEGFECDLTNDKDSVNSYFDEQVSKDILIASRDKICKAAHNCCITREEKACLALEEMLRNSGAPLYLYDDIMNWAIINKRSLPSRVPLISRKKLYNLLSEKLYGEAADDMRPKEVPTTLPSGRRCGITTFSIYSQITSLLTNSEINHWSDYFFHPTPTNPFNMKIFSDWETGSFNDIETSVWYDKTRRSALKDDNSEILVPICLFIDSTVLSLSGSLSLEPVMFSLMIHNRQTRKKPDAWLPLGYIHDPTSVVGKKYKKPEEKISDYHFMLSIILSDLMKLVDESNTGLKWCFNNVPGKHNIHVTKTLVFRLAFIIGDTKGHDILCGRMGSHNLTPGLCRDCDMLTEFADDTSIPCNFLKQDELHKKSDLELRAMSFYRIPFFTFEGLKFGASPYGVNCSTTIDIIHGILIGMMEYLYCTFSDQLTANQLKELSNTVAFIATFSSKGIPGFVECQHFRKGLLHVKGIMTAKKKLSRCFLVFLALKTKTLYTYMLHQTGKLPAVIQKKRRAMNSTNSPIGQRDLDEYSTHISNSYTSTDEDDENESDIQISHFEVNEEDFIHQSLI